MPWPQMYIPLILYTIQIYVPCVFFHIASFGLTLLLLSQPLLNLFCLLPISLRWPMICTCTPIQMPITCTSSLPTPPQFKFLLLNSTHLLNCDLQLFIYAHKNMITLSKYCVCHIQTQSHILTSLTSWTLMLRLMKLNAYDQWLDLTCISAPCMFYD